MQYVFVYITTKNKNEAQLIGKTIVSERLVACVNIMDGMNSIYWWEGKLCEDSEAVLIAKTVDSLLDQLVSRVKELHSYKVPCIITMPITKGNPEYLSWISEQVKK
jgi:periplasmic divalent cation tolerance protein